MESPFDENNWNKWPEDEMYAWQWDGKSIESIKEHAQSHGKSLVGLIEDYHPEGWPATVPPEYRGEVTGPIRPDASKGENGCAGILESVAILACDSMNNVLFLKHYTDIYLGADGLQVIEMHLDAAKVMIDEFRADNEEPVPPPGMTMG